MRGTWWMPLMLTAGMAAGCSVDEARSTASEVADQVEVQVDRMATRFEGPSAVLDGEDHDRDAAGMPADAVRAHNEAAAHGT